MLRYRPDIAETCRCHFTSRVRDRSLLEHPQLGASESLLLSSFQLNPSSRIFQLLFSILLSFNSDYKLALTFTRQQLTCTSTPGHCAMAGSDASPDSSSAEALTPGPALQHTPVMSIEDDGTAAIPGDLSLLQDSKGPGPAVDDEAGSEQGLGDLDGDDDDHGGLFGSDSEEEGKEETRQPR